MIKGTTENVWIDIIKTDSIITHRTYLCYLNMIGKGVAVAKDLEELKLYQVLNKLK